MKNIKVTAVYSKSLKNTVGPSNTLRRYHSNLRFFLERGIDLKIFTPDSYENFSTISSNSKFYTKLKSIVLSFLQLFPIGTWFILNQKHLKYSQFIIKKFLIENNESDVLVFHEIFTCYEYLINVTNPTSKIVLFLHNNGDKYRMLFETFPKLNSAKYKNKIYEIYEKTLNRIDRLVFISENAKNNFVKLNQSFLIEKVDFILNGVPDIPDERKNLVNEKIALRSYNKFNLVCVGTLNRRKSQISLVEALNKVNPDIKKKIHIKLVGGGIDLKLIKTKIDRYGLSDNFTLTGALSDVSSELLDANIFILPSLDEGLPLSILEAMRYSLPIIGTNVAGIPETIFNNKSGIIIETGIKPLISLFNNIEKYDWKEMGRISRLKYENEFTLEHNISSYCKIIKKTINSN